MDYEAYKSPDRSDLRRALQYAVSCYEDILTLRKPLDLLRKVENDHKQYTLLQSDMADLPNLKSVLQYLERYKGMKRALGDVMDNYGRNIDCGYGYNEAESG